MEKKDVLVRHISVLLGVTLYRRVAELNFRGVDFRALPREVMRNIVDDFNNIGGDEEIACRDVHLARCLQFAMHKFRLSLFVKDLEPGGSITFCFLIV